MGLALIVEGFNRKGPAGLPGQQQRAELADGLSLGGGSGEHLVQDAVGNNLGFRGRDVGVTNRAGDVGMAERLLDECQISAIA